MATTETAAPFYTLHGRTYFHCITLTSSVLNLDGLTIPIEN